MKEYVCGIATSIFVDSNPKPMGERGSDRVIVFGVHGVGGGSKVTILAFNGLGMVQFFAVLHAKTLENKNR